MPLLSKQRLPQRRRLLAAWAPTSLAQKPMLPKASTGHTGVGSNEYKPRGYGMKSGGRGGYRQTKVQNVMKVVIVRSYHNAG